MHVAAAGARGLRRRAARVSIAASEEERHMATGTVKWFNMQKGFGFIQPDDGGKDVFVHITAVQAAGLNGLNDGQKVSYEVVTERGKQAAANLKLG
jgi:cold shock protein